jgi:soluble cytochrome b562
MGQEDYREVTSFVDRFIRRLKWLRGVEGLCLIAICVLVIFSLGLGVREIKSAIPYAPLLYSVLAGGLLAALLARVLFQCARKISREWAALYIEAKQPRLKNNLINSLQLYPRVSDAGPAAGISATMVLALLRATRTQIGSLRTEELIPTARIKSTARLLGALFVPVLAAVLFNPSSVGETFSLLVRPLKDLPPSEISIEVTPKGARVLRGADVTVQVATSGAQPSSVELITWSETEEGREKRAVESLPMEALGERKFAATLRNLRQGFQYRVAAGPFSSPPYGVEVVERPELVQLKVTIYPPHYTALASTTVNGGNAEAIRGSTLRLEALASKGVAKAKLLLDQGREVALKLDGRRLQGSLVLFQPQRYQIMIEDALGFQNLPITYQLQLKPDGFPIVEVLNPTADLEINGDEVLPLEFSARDDFGIQEISLVVNFGERQEKIALPLQGRKNLILRERYPWDLGRLGLREGSSEVRYHLEVYDNDTISGPKLGTSQALRLKLRDLRGEHQKVAEMIHGLSERMLDLLAHHLERPLAGENDHARAQVSDPQMEQKIHETLKQVEQAMQRSEKDRLSDFATWSDLDALRRNLRFTREELLRQRDQAASPEVAARLDDEIAAELERMSLLAEEIGKRLKTQELASTAQDLIKSQERLLESLDRLQSGDKALDQVLKEISELAKQLESLQQALSQLGSQLPDEFTNSEAMRGLNFNDMRSALDEIRKRLMQGDLEGARQLARELFNQMASMLAALQNARQSAMSSTMGRMQGEMMRSTSELQQIVREQQEILLDTEGLNKERLKEKEARLREQLARFQAEAEKKLAELAELFPDEERESERTVPRVEILDDATFNSLVREMLARLGKKDFSGFAEIMEMGREELGKRRMPEQEARAKKAEGSLEELKGGLDALLAESVDPLKDAEKSTLRDLAHRQGVVKDRTRTLHERLNSLFQLFPALDPKITKDIEEAAKSMGAAEGRLGGLDPQGAVPPERDALERLSQSQQQMQTAMQQLAQRGQLGRLPVAYLFRRGRFLPSGVLVPLPGMPEFPQFEFQGGITGLDTEKFRLPGKEDYKAPRNFREEILESLKQGIPPQLKEQIESYFKNLSE